jgi:hypothetical protein
VPRVPSAYDAPVVQDRPQSTPYFQPGNVQGAFGVGLGGAVADLGEQAGRLDAAERNKQLSVVVQSYVNQATTWENETLTAAFELKGKDALGVADKHVSAFDKLARDNEMNIRDERAKIMYRSALGGIRDRMRGALHRHEMGQLDAVEKAETVAAQEHAVSNAALLFNDNQAIAGNLAAGERAVVASSRRNGFTPELAEGALRKFRTALHAGVVEAHLAAGQGVDAAAYLADNRDDMDGEAASALALRIKPMADDQRVNLAADALWGKAGGDFGKALAAVKPDDPLRSKIEGELEHRARQQDGIRIDRDREAYQAFYPAWIEAGRSYRRVPAQAWAALSPQQQEAIRDQEAQDLSRQRSLASMGAAERAAAKQEARMESAVKLGDLMVLAEDDPGALLNAFDDPRVLAGLTDTDVKRAKALQARAVKGLRSAEGKAITPAAERVLIEEGLTAGLLKKGTTGQGEADREKRRGNARWTALLDSYDSWQDGYITEHKKLPGADDARKAVREMLVRSVHDTWMPFDERSSYRFEAGFDAAEVVVPDADRALIEEALKQSGMEITEEAIHKRYKRVKGLR